MSAFKVGDVVVEKYKSKDQVREEGIVEESGNGLSKVRWSDGPMRGEVMWVADTMLIDVRETGSYVILQHLTQPAPPALVLDDSPVPESKALTYDNGKLPLANLPWAAVREMSAVQAYGHEKYKDFNNYRKGMEVTRNLSCSLRHIMSYIDGEDLDPESNRSHLAHAMCRLAFVLQNIHEGTAIDDRYKPDAHAEAWKRLNEQIDSVDSPSNRQAG